MLHYNAKDLHVYRTVNQFQKNETITNRVLLFTRSLLVCSAEWRMTL